MAPLLSNLNQAFLRLHNYSSTLIANVPEEMLYWRPKKIDGTISSNSCGELILRSAAIVEQTFGGITANLWDDAFEWTLPETLSTPSRIEEYLKEVEATRLRGFALIKSDNDLAKEVLIPSGELVPLFKLLLDTLLNATHYQGEAVTIFRLFSDKRLPSL
jgi:hypothetical protein